MRVAPSGSQRTVKSQWRIPPLRGFERLRLRLACFRQFTDGAVQCSIRGLAVRSSLAAAWPGCFAARVLANHFKSVTIIERDAHTASPEFRRGVPQGRHAHGLLLRGQQTVFRLFPEIREALLKAGARAVNMGRDVNWLHFGVWKRRFDSRLEGLTGSRPLIEWTIGEHLRRLPDVRVLNEWSFQGLKFEGGRVVGVRAHPRGEPATELQADLVIDASGRGSRTPAELEANGFRRPQETNVRIDVGYATGIFRAPETPRDWKMLYVIAKPPAKRGALILPLEPDEGGNRWMATLVGMHGDHPPGDADGFLAFAKSLPAPDMYEALKRAEPLNDIVRYGYAASRRRHYENLRCFPEGLLVLGDALCSFNPIYGQGMSAASMYADVLEQCLQEQGGRAGLWRSFFSRAARVAEMPWQLATGEDLRFKETIGPRSPALRFLQWYTGKVLTACGRDELITERFYEVMHLLKPPSAVFSPDVIWRLLRPQASSKSSNLAGYAAGTSR
jgi:2-polyprenyl-6-methoxyphenol hydroxylase-like FAD-dependent oxidoreductase